MDTLHKKAIYEAIYVFTISISVVRKKWRFLSSTLFGYCDKMIKFKLKSEILFYFNTQN